MSNIIYGAYSLTYFTYTKLDELFMEKSYYIGIKYPYKWYEFIHKILSNKKITYFKDTTMIVSLLDLEIHQIKILFEILKEYLKDKLIKKVLYHREFIIVHFHNTKTISIFKSKYLWIAVFSYYMIKNKLSNLDIHLQAVLEYIEHKDIVDMVINTNNFTYLFTTNKQINIDNENIKLVYICDKLVNNKTLPTNYNIVKFSLNQNEFIRNLLKTIL